MKFRMGLVAALGLVILAGCKKDNASTTGVNNSRPIVNQIVEASCGECNFGMEGTSCDLAVRIDGQAYFVDGTSIDEHGDTHAEDGMCNTIRQARVTGEIKNGRFVASSFELLPLDK
jgi:hypothetical protein